MLKILAILALALCVFSVQAYAQTDKAAERSGNQKPALPIPPAVPQQTDSPTFQPEHKEHIDADVRVVSSPEKDGYDKAVFWANLALAVIGAIGIGIGICTLLAIKRQVNLQGAAMQQWIELSQWKSELPESLVNFEGRHLTISIGVTNPTNFPMTIMTGQVLIANSAIGPGHQVMESMPEDAFLSPNVPYGIMLIIPVSTEQADLFSTDGIALGVIGYFHHIGVLKRKSIQRFGGTLICSKFGTTFQSELQMNPQSGETPDRDQRPKPN